jgi:hypothetical protein
MALLAYARVSPVGAIVAFWAVVMTAGLMLADLRRRKEVVLLSNLGVQTTNAVLLGTVPAIAMEVLLLPFGR